ncbi:MAG: hypothetical protein WAO58_06695 [Fimbriimonadaceae bacterium]
MMITKRIGVYALGAVAMTALAIPMTLSFSQAQVAGGPPATTQGPGAGPRTQAGGPQGGPRPGLEFGQRGGGGGGMGMMMGGGGQATMVVAGNFLYILRGNIIYKVDANSLRVVAQGELPMPQMPQFGDSAPGRFGTRPAPGAGGGGGTPPPPPSAK